MAPTTRPNPDGAPTERGRLIISCPDRPGIVAAVADALFRQGANIVQSDQYTTDPRGGRFFMRVEFDLPVGADHRRRLEGQLEPVARRFDMEWRLRWTADRKRMAVFVSKREHCLLDLLWQWRAGELDADIVCVVSNHETLRQDVEAFGLPYHHFPITRDNRDEQEAAQLELLEGRVDFIVLARYMQILSPRFVDRYRNRIINIHHSFLPAFVGSNPYQQAYDRGVKIIGATAHYVTEELDQGPIIEQDVIRVNHRDHPADLARKGRDLERIVLARAVKWHIDDRIIVYGNKTVVFV